MSGLVVLEFRVSYEEISWAYLNSISLNEKASLIEAGPLHLNLTTLLALAVAAVPAKIAATRMLKLAVAFGADADHVGHDGAGYGLLVRGVCLLFARYRACRVRQILHAANGDHDALGNGLFG